MGRKKKGNIRYHTIGVAPKEYEVLNQAKSQYEADIGHKMDWGRFLAILATGFLIGTGVVILRGLRDQKRTETPRDEQNGKET